MNKSFFYIDALVNQYYFDGEKWTRRHHHNDEQSLNGVCIIFLFRYMSDHNQTKKKLHNKQNIIGEMFCWSNCVLEKKNGNRLCV